MAEDQFDDCDEDDWIELERAPKGATPFTEASVKVTLAKLGNPKFAKGAPKPRATILLRGAAGDWIRENGPRFRIAIGGADANLLRIQPDIERGKFEAHDPPGASHGGSSQRFNLGVVQAWPTEAREATPAEWSVKGGFMRLVLPADFAKPQTKAPLPSPAPARQALDPPPQHRANAAPPPRAAVRSENVIGLAGEPAPGRSAADQRKARGAA